MSRKPFTEHEEFMTAGQAANDGLHQALLRMGLDDKALFGANLEEAANRVVDDLTRLLLRAHDYRQSKGAAA